MQRAAEFVADALRKAGLENIEIIQTDLHPLVYADWLHAPGKPTVLCYGHFDVQPPDPLDLWNSPPFEPVERDGNLYARGSADDKGQMYMHIKAVEALRAVNGTLPINLKFLIEGEEEIGGGSVAKYVEHRKPEKLKADIALVSDTALFAEGIPTICNGLRGLMYTEIEAHGPSKDLHSGLFYLLVQFRIAADFDGDQMAVHVPLSLEAQLEARVLMMSTNNILHPANGSPIIVPSQDIVLGLYYLSLLADNAPGQWKLELHSEKDIEADPKKSNIVQGFYRNLSEIEHALREKAVALHSKIKYRYQGVDDEGTPYRKWYETTPGRAILGEVLPKQPKISFDLVNKLMTKREISNMIDTVYRHCGQKETVIFCDRVMALGFHHAFKAGISFGKDDMVVPHTKRKIVEDTREQVKDFEQQYNDGLITQGEKYNKVVDAWLGDAAKIAEAMMKEISAARPAAEKGQKSQVNSIYMMAHSGARGSPAQMRRLRRHARPHGQAVR